MKVAVAIDLEQVSHNFGHCDGFKIYEVENNEIKSTTFFSNPSHEQEFLPVFLDKNGVNAIISGGMAQGTINLFNQKKIDVITGAFGDSDIIVQQYIEGTLFSDNSVCQKHQHRGVS